MRQSISSLTLCIKVDSIQLTVLCLVDEADVDLMAP